MKRNNRRNISLGSADDNCRNIKISNVDEESNTDDLGELIIQQKQHSNARTQYDLNRLPESPSLITESTVDTPILQRSQQPPIIVINQQRHPDASEFRLEDSTRHFLIVGTKNSNNEPDEGSCEPVIVSNESYASIESVRQKIASINRQLGNEPENSSVRTISLPRSTPIQVVHRQSASVQTTNEIEHESRRPLSKNFPSIPDWIRSIHPRPLNCDQVPPRTSTRTPSYESTVPCTNSNNVQKANVRPMTFHQQTQTDLYSSIYDSQELADILLFARNMIVEQENMAAVHCELRKRFGCLTEEIEKLKTIVVELVESKKKRRSSPDSSPVRLESILNENVTQRHAVKHDDQNPVVVYTYSSAAKNQTNKSNQLNESIVEVLPISSIANNYETNTNYNKLDDTKSLSSNFSIRCSSSPVAISPCGQSDVSFARPRAVARSPTRRSNSFSAEYSFDGSSSSSASYSLTTSSPASPSTVCLSPIGQRTVGPSPVGQPSAVPSEIKQKRTPKRKLEASDLTGPTYVIGKNGTKIPKLVFDQMRWETPTSATRQLLITLFPRSVLASHSLTGKQSPGIIYNNRK